MRAYLAVSLFFLGTLLLRAEAASAAPIFSDEFKVTNRAGDILYDEKFNEGTESPMDFIPGFAIEGVRLGIPYNISFDVYLTEPASCPPTCPPETDPATPGTVSDLIRLIVTPVAGTVIRDLYSFSFYSEPFNPTWGIPPTVPPVVPATEQFVENGTLQQITSGLFPTLVGKPPPSAPPFLVYVQSCSDPCAIPEPLTLSLFGAGLAGAVTMRRRKKPA